MKIETKFGIGWRCRLNIHEKRERCAIRMGWEKKKTFWHFPDAQFGTTGVIEDSRGRLCMPSDEYGEPFWVEVEDYHPDLSDAASLKQADDLLHVVLAKYDWVVSNYSDGRISLELLDKKTSATAVEADGPWWNSALVDAVARMEVGDGT